MLTSLAPIDGDTILSLADARVHLNLTADDDHHDAAVEAARDAAVSWTEYYSGHSLQEREFLWEIDHFCSVMRLPIGPVASIEEFDYYDGAGVDQSVDPSDWLLFANTLSAAAGTTWPYGTGLRIEFVAGYTLPADIPFHLLAAVKLAMTAFFEDRANPDLSGAMKVADQFRSIL